MNTIPTLLQFQLMLARRHKQEALDSLESACIEVRDAEKLLHDYEGLLLSASQGGTTAKEVMAHAGPAYTDPMSREVRHG